MVAGGGLPFSGSRDAVGEMLREFCVGVDMW